MTLGKLKELLDTMTEKQLKQEVVVVLEDHNSVKVDDIRLLRDEAGKLFQAFVTKH